MTVGTPLTSSAVDMDITNLTVAMRDLMQAVANLSLNINGQGNGLTFLESIGYAPADAEAAQAAVSYMNTIAGVYFGTATQGSDFNFNQVLSQYWSGR
jgi:hypothetical protein